MQFAKNHGRRPADISQEDGESVDVPEATDAEFATARPFREVLPAQFKAWKKMGRPPVAAPKVHIGFRLAADVVSAIRATGRGYNARVEKVLRDALAKGEL
ncbi:MAG TPA: BrnA antitoxin family protein [Stellaceae bacterium]|nr:BrnA antitoxin family protein [Stellaceae bacterium]